jgi:hypothetical protein
VNQKGEQMANDNTLCTTLATPYSVTSGLGGAPRTGPMINLAPPMQVNVKVGHVSWINDQPNAIYASYQCEMLEPDWAPKTFLGLSATSNDPSPDPLTDFRGYQNVHDFRSMTYCEFNVGIDVSTGKVVSFKVIDAFHDGGWTKAFQMRHWPSTVFSFDMSIYSNSEYAGEFSPLSVVATQARHQNSTITTVPSTVKPCW